MSRPNPTIRACSICGDPPAALWPASDLCEKHRYEAGNPKICWNASELLKAAQFSERAASAKLEFNFPASVIQQADIALNPFTERTPELEISELRRALRRNEEAGEMGMLQLAFLNEDCNPGSAFITGAAAAGWRYRIDKGFYRLEVGA